MGKRKWIAGAALLVLTQAAVVESARSAAAPLDAKQSSENIRAHMAFLADDLLQGRETGSDGYGIAARYVASQFAQLGLKPAGDQGSYFQAVPLLAYRSAEQGTLVLHGKGNSATPLQFGEEFLPGANPNTPDIKQTSALVFVGYGVVAPERKRDDYRGLDVRGKVVVVLTGAPSSIPSEERAYYGTPKIKKTEAARHGAIGIIVVDRPSDEKLRPFKTRAQRWQSWGMTWRHPDGKPFAAVPSVPTVANISAAGAPKLFAGAPATWEKIVAEAEKPAGNTPRFVLPATLEINLRVETKPAESMNVAGLIEGSDPDLKKETVILSAHLDHIGLTTTVQGDQINNGALDNAAGIATLLEVGRAFHESGRASRRSVLILAVTAEEKGIVGSDYFARNPTVPRSSITANVNLDMPILTYDFTDVIAFGAERSTVGEAVRRAGEGLHVALSADPMPEEAIFTRSDHYSFVQQGVPSVFLITGFQNGGEARFKDFLAKCYHKPCDDLALPILYDAGAKFAVLNYEIARELADGEQRAAWKSGDFFATKFGEKH